MSEYTKDKIQHLHASIYANPDDKISLLRAALRNKEVEIDFLRTQLASITSERDDWRKIAEDWTNAAISVQRPPEFYKDYNEKTMNAMQAFLSKAEKRLAEAEAAIKSVREHEHRDEDFVATILKAGSHIDADFYDKSHKSIYSAGISNGHRCAASCFDEYWEKYHKEGK